MKRLVFSLFLAAASPAAADELRPFDKTSWPAILKAHAGRPMIVHFWGMTCGPCRLEMPRWGAFVAKYPTLDLVTIDTDIVASPSSTAEVFLQRAGMPMTDAWRFGDSFAEKLYFAVDPNWHGEIPMTLLIGRDGRTTTKLGAVDMEDVELWLATQR